MLHRTSMDSYNKMDITKLLSKAAALTPDYPAHLMCERKIKFLEQIMIFSISLGSTNQGTKPFNFNLN